jgi:hypothetical protein
VRVLKAGEVDAYLALSDPMASNANLNYCNHRYGKGKEVTDDVDLITHVV